MVRCRADLMTGATLVTTQSNLHILTILQKFATRESQAAAVVLNALGEHGPLDMWLHLAVLFATAQ